LPSPSGDGNEDTSQQIACSTQNQEGGHVCLTNQLLFNASLHHHCHRLQVMVMMTQVSKLHAQPKIKREGMYALQINFCSMLACIIIAIAFR